MTGIYPPLCLQIKKGQGLGTNDNTKTAGRNYQTEKEKNVCILAHAYQGQQIWEVADYIGDSYGLSKQAAKSDADTVIMCGVRFMAETVKILSPQKKVLLANPIAGCPMAD